MKSYLKFIASLLLFSLNFNLFLPTLLFIEINILSPGELNAYSNSQRWEKEFVFKGNQNIIKKDEVVIGFFEKDIPIPDSNNYDKVQVAVIYYPKAGYIHVKSRLNEDYWCVAYKGEWRIKGYGYDKYVDGIAGGIQINNFKNDYISVDAEVDPNIEIDYISGGYQAYFKQFKIKVVIQTIPSNLPSNKNNEQQTITEFVAEKYNTLTSPNSQFDNPVQETDVSQAFEKGRNMGKEIQNKSKEEAKVDAINAMGDAIINILKPYYEQSRTSQTNQNVTDNNNPNNKVNKGLQLFSLLLICGLGYLLYNNLNKTQ